MSKKSNYISTNRSKHYLKCHLIFVCKYRKKLLTGQLNDDIKHIFQSIANGSDFEIEVMETDLDHIHFLIRYIPRWSIAQIVRRLKQQSTLNIWQLHSTTLRKHYWYKDMFWSDGYFVCSIGEASPDTVPNQLNDCRFQAPPMRPDNFHVAMVGYFELVDNLVKQITRRGRKVEGVIFFSQCLVHGTKSVVVVGQGAHNIYSGSFSLRRSQFLSLSLIFR